MASPTPANTTGIVNVAVTGSNGSVGHRVVLYLLKQGCSVLGIDVTPLPNALLDLIRKELGTQVFEPAPGRFMFKQIDLRDWDAVLGCFKAGFGGQLQFDAVVHLGAIRDPGDYGVETHNTNVVSSYNVLRAAAELGINRVAQASSVNAVPLVYSEDKNMQLEYFPLDEAHHTRVDEPYGLSKAICELQASSLCLRYPALCIASLRLHWSVPSISFTQTNALESEDRSRKDLWGWILEDEGARAFWLALNISSPRHPSLSSSDPSSSGGQLALGTGWTGHEAFFIVAPTTRRPEVDTKVLKEKYFPQVRVREGFDLAGRKGFFDCGKAKRVLGWVHREGDC